jgi:prepilin peptidase CpaA
MGGGDIKLMAGFGALLGFHQVLAAALWIGAVGGVLAVGVLGVRAAMRALRGNKVMTAEQAERQDSIPYAPAIALGVWLSLAARV